MPLEMYPPAPSTPAHIEHKLLASEVSPEEEDKRVSVVTLLWDTVCINLYTAPSLQ